MRIAGHTREISSRVLDIRKKLYIPSIHPYSLIYYKNYIFNRVYEIITIIKPELLFAFKYKDANERIAGSVTLSIDFLLKKEMLTGFYKRLHILELCNKIYELFQYLQTKYFSEYTNHFYLLFASTNTIL